MINRNLLQRLKRLEDKIEPREPETKAAHYQIVQRLYAARRRMALLGDERFAAYSEMTLEPEIQTPAPRDSLVETLHAARKRMNLENAALRGETDDFKPHTPLDPL